MAVDRAVGLLFAGGAVRAQGNGGVAALPGLAIGDDRAETGGSRAASTLRSGPPRARRNYRKSPAHRPPGTGEGAVSSFEASLLHLSFSFLFYHVRTALKRDCRKTAFSFFAIKFISPIASPLPSYYN